MDLETGQAIFFICIGIAVVILSTGISAWFWQKWQTEGHITASSDQTKK